MMPMQQHTPGGTMMPMQPQYTPGGTLMPMQQQMGGGMPTQQVHTPGGGPMRPNQSPGMPQPSPAQQNADACSFENLDGRFLDAAVHALHSFPEVCTETGRRFRTKEQLQAHKDQLFQKKQAAEDGRAVASRPWFGDSNTWLGLKSAGQENDADDDDADDDGADGTGSGKKGAASADVLPWEEGLDSCPICGEDFDKYWDEDGTCPVSIYYGACLKLRPRLWLRMRLLCPLLKLREWCRCLLANAQLRTGRVTGCCVA